MNLTLDERKTIDASLFDLAEGDELQRTLTWALNNGRSDFFAVLDLAKPLDTLKQVLEILTTLQPQERNNFRYRGAILNAERELRLLQQKMVQLLQ
jgi:hypothetical protein